MDEALRLGEEARGRSAPNPNVGCVIVSSSGRIIGRGATAPGGRPHAEAVALAQAGRRANGGAVYVTLEPCAHDSPRGPACTDLLLAAKPERLVIALKDPDRANLGQGHPPAAARGHRSDARRRAGGGEALARRLAHAAQARPPADHAQARAVDRRQDRASIGRIEVDHRRGRARPCPSRAGATAT